MRASTIRIDGTDLEVAEGSTVLAAALSAGMYIPHLCHHADLPPARGSAPAAAVWRGSERVEHDGDDRPHDGCGLCVVRVDGMAEPQHACELEVVAGLEITTVGPDLEEARRQRLAVILAHHPHACLTCAQREGCSREPCSSNVAVAERCCELLGRCELEKLATHLGVPGDVPRYQPRGLASSEDALFRWRPELCVGCLRCVRACSDLKGVGLLGWVRSAGEVVVGRLSQEDHLADCRYCGACVEVCPTGAMVDRDVATVARERRLVPCRSGCPAGVDVPRFLRAAARGDLEEAARVSLDRIPLPNVLGRVCFHPCEGDCRRRELGGALSVCRVRRSVFDKVGVPDPWPEVADSGKRVAVIGGGPAGLASAHYLRRKGHRVTVLEAAPEAGGMLRYGIPEYRLPRDVLRRDLDLIEAQGVEIRTGMTLGRDLSLAELRDEGYDAVLVAAGLAAPKPLSIPGVELEGVLYGVPFLRDVASGAFPAGGLDGQDVVVIGGGNVAVDTARTALRLGGATVTLACLEARAEMPAYPAEVEEAEAEGIEILDSWGPERILGEGSVIGVRLVRCTAVFDERGRFAPTYDATVTREVDAGAVIVAIGQDVEPSLAAAQGLHLDQRGLLAAEGPVFGAGDLVSGPGSVVEAVASGRRAAEAVDRALGGDGVIPSILEPESPAQRLGRVEGFAVMARRFPELAPAAARTSGFGQVEATLAHDAAAAEAGRCLQCDLRLAIAPPVLPPMPWLVLTREAVAEVPATAGAYELLGADHVAVKIAGVPNLRRALEDELAAADPPPFFAFHSDPMYSKRESELIQQFLGAHGRMPDAGDDLDDLF